ncbi:MAG: hypothetical protein LAT61_06395 [Alcanivorax sp.]|nr:hypothetical protein [Alcanivorax sp.]
MKMSLSCSLLLAMLLTVGCASTSQVITHYPESGYVGEIAGQHILLAGRTPEGSVRTEWENACAQVLQNAGLQVTRSHQAMPQWYEPGNEALKRWAANNDADAILVAELTGLLLAPFQQAREYRLNPDAGMAYDPVREEVGIITPIRDFREMRDNPELDQSIEVTLFTGSGDALWRGEVDTREANNIKAIARSQCKALVKLLGAR